MGTEFSPTPLESYLNVYVVATELYTVGSINFASDVPIRANALKHQGGMSATLIVSEPVACAPLLSINKLSGLAFDQHIGSSLVGWSDIGDIDFRITRENIAGNSYMQWLGDVYQIKKLGNNAIVYGSGGITKLTPAGRYYSQEELPVPGIKGKLAIGGDDSTHYFVSQSGDLFKLSLEGGLSRIGFRRFLKNLNSLCCVNYMASRQEVFITDGVRGFHLTESGLGGCVPLISGAGSYFEFDYLVGTPIDRATVNYSMLTYRRNEADSTSDKAYFETDIISFNYPGLKALTTIVVHGTVTANSKARLAVDYGKGWVYTKWKKIHNSGYCHFGTTGENFKVQVIDVPVVEELQVTVQKTDKRFVRSIRLKGD